MRWKREPPTSGARRSRNSMTSPYLWLLCLLSVIPAVLWWQQYHGSSPLSCSVHASYVLLYWSIVRFKTPQLARVLRRCECVHRSRRSRGTAPASSVLEWPTFLKMRRPISPMELLPAPHPSPDENALVAERREKLAAIRARGIAFPNDFKPKHRAAELVRKYGHLDNEALEPQAIAVSVAGRLMLKRVMGKASFATLQDATGRIQLRVSVDAIGETDYGFFKHFDLGDIVGAEGTLFKTKTGELTVKVEKLRLLTKSLRPLPDKFHGMADRGGQVPPALRRPHHRRGGARALRGTQQDAVVDPPLHGRARLHGGRDADAPSDPGRRERQAVRDASQRARPADVPAHRARALSQAPDRRRLRARVRDQPELSQRRHLGPAQPRVHDDGVLCRVLEPPRPDGLHRRGAAPRGARGRRLGASSATPGAKSISTPSSHG